MSAPGNLHPPPADLASRRLPVTKFRGTWYRVHKRTHGALYFGKSRLNRFDAPAGQFGVLYVARAERGAFIETFGHDTGIRVLDAKELEARALSRVEVKRPLRLVDLRREGLARLGVDAELISGPYAIAQAWSLALHDHPALADGVAYPARHDLSQISAAIFERVGGELETQCMGTFMEPHMARLTGSLLDVYDFGLTGAPTR